MKIIEVLQYIGVFIAVMVAAGAGIGGFWFAFRSKETKLLRGELKETKDAVDRCERKHIESEHSVANLQGQIDVLKNVPLASIDASLQGLATSNQQILTTLNNSALIAATDRDALLGSHIGEQTVENQVIMKEEKK